MIRRLLTSNVQAALFASAVVAAVLFCLSPAAAQEKPAADSLDFERDVRPILNQHCVKCHGAEKQKGGLRLDRRRYAAMGGESHKPVLGGTLEINELYRRVATDDEDEVMPKEGRRLNEMELAVIRRWVERGTPWPDEEGSDIVPPWWERAAERFNQHFDRYYAPVLPYLVAALVLILLCERSKMWVARDSRWATGRAGRVVRWLSRVPRSFYLAALLAIFLVELVFLEVSLRKEVARLQARRPLTSGGLSVEAIYGSPPIPFRPEQPKQLGGEYYRGNCERSADLFNVGNYATAILRVSLHGADRERLAVGDPVPDGGLLIRFEIERAPGATRSLFSEQIMLNIFLSPEVYPSSPADPLDEPVWLEPVVPRERWAAFYPISNSSGIDQGDLSGLVYVYKGQREGVLIGGHYHYGIKYDLKLADGRIAEGSDLWVGSIYWHTGIALPADPRKVPFEQWFSAKPLPIITGKNTDDPELLGVDDHPDADPAEPPPAEPPRDGQRPGC